MGSRRRGKDAAACSTIYAGAASRRKKIRGRGQVEGGVHGIGIASVGVSEVGGAGGVHGMGRADGVVATAAQEARWPPGRGEGRQRRTLGSARPDCNAPVAAAIAGDVRNTQRSRV
jgi:hypothetical protein